MPFQWFLPIPPGCMCLKFWQKWKWSHHSTETNMVWEVDRNLVNRKRGVFYWRLVGQWENHRIQPDRPVMKKRRTSAERRLCSSNPQSYGSEEITLLFRTPISCPVKWKQTMWTNAWWVRFSAFDYAFSMNCVILNESAGSWMFSIKWS